MIKLNKTDWLDWLGRSEWTVAEAAALSLGLAPENVTTCTDTKTIYPPIMWGNELDALPTIEKSYRIELSPSAREFGRKLEVKLQTTAQRLGGIGHSFSAVAGSPTNIIAKMKYEEWPMPPEMKAFKASEGLTRDAVKASSLKVEKPKSKDAVRKLNAQARLNNAYISGNIPAILSLTEIAAYVGLSRTYLNTCITARTFPAPSVDKGGNTKKLYKTSDIDAWLNKQV